MRLPLPATAVVVYLGIRVLGLVVVAFLLRHGAYQRAHVSLEQWITGGDGAYYRAIAAHGYDHELIQLSHSAVFAFFPGYPAAIDALAWLPGVSLVSAGFAVTILAGLVAAWGLATLGLKLTADSRISLIMVAIWAAAPGSIALSRVHSEALFCALAFWALVALVDRRWLTERIPVYLHVYTVVVAVVAFTVSANWFSEEPRYFLPAVLLTLPVARLLAPLRSPVLVPLIVVLTFVSAWMGVYLLIIAHWAS